jgi:hypothetical protein
VRRRNRASSRENLRFLGAGVGQPLRRVGDLPQGSRQRVSGKKDVECARAPQRRQSMLDRLRERHHGSGAAPPDFDNHVEIHLMLEVQVKVGEQVAEEWVGGQTAG